MMNDALKDMMQDKELNFKFLMHIQAQEYEQAYSLGTKILKLNPHDESVNRFMIFLQQNMENHEDDEDEDEVKDEESEEEEELEEGMEDEQEQEEEDSWEWEYYTDEGEQQNEIDNNEDIMINEDTEGDISIAIEQKIQDRENKQQFKVPLQTLKSANLKGNRNSTPKNIDGIFPKITQVKRPQSQQKTLKQEKQQSQPQQVIQNQKPAVNSLRFPSSMAVKKTINKK